MGEGDGPARATTEGRHPRGRLLARLCWSIERRAWLLSATSIAAASCFVVGCVAFYFDAFYLHGVTLFLLGSLLFLGEAVADAIRRHGPAE